MLEKASSKQTRRIVGLCRQCETEIFGTGLLDLSGLPESRRIVSCYGCGLTRVNEAGECLHKCAGRHNWSALDRLLSLFGVTPKRLSE